MVHAKRSADELNVNSTGTGLSSCQSFTPSKDFSDLTPTPITMTPPHLLPWAPLTSIILMLGAWPLWLLQGTFYSEHHSVARPLWLLQETLYSEHRSVVSNFASPTGSTASQGKSSSDLISRSHCLETSTTFNRKHLALGKPHFLSSSIFFFFFS